MCYFISKSNKIILDTESNWKRKICGNCIYRNLRVWGGDLVILLLLSRLHAIKGDLVRNFAEHFYLLHFLGIKKFLKKRFLEFLFSIGILKLIKF